MRLQPEPSLFAQPKRFQHYKTLAVATAVMDMGSAGCGREIPGACRLCSLCNSPTIATTPRQHALLRLCSSSIFPYSYQMCFSGLRANTIKISMGCPDGARIG
jgi:hypothetical protein